MMSRFHEPVLTANQCGSSLVQRIDARLSLVCIIGGDHRLLNYRSTTTLHEEEEEKGVMCTVVIESYVVDVPVENTKEDTCTFADTIVGCNLRSLARMTENMSSITN
ncbi:hypothetical protein SLA2020_279660 [Shorea laevis]